MPYQLKKLSEICRFQNGFAFKSELFREKGLPIIRISNIQDNNISYNKLVYFNLSDYEKNLSNYIVSKGDLVIAMSGATTGKLAINNNDEDFYLNQRVGKFIFKDEVTKIYTHYFLSTKIQENLNQSVGSAIPNLSTEQINNIQIPLPPLPTQKAIVQKLDEAFARIDASIELAEKSLKAIEEENASVLEEVFGSGEYEEKSFGDIVDNLDGKRRPVKASERKNTHATYPYYGASGIIDYVDGYTHEGESLLISEDGANLVIRKYPIAFIAEGKYWVNNHAHIVKGKNGISDNHFLKYYFACLDISVYVTGSAQPKFNQKNLNSIKLPLPPLSKQKEIVEYLDRVFAVNAELKGAYEEKIQSLKELKQSLLREAFEGRLVRE